MAQYRCGMSMDVNDVKPAKLAKEQAPSKELAAKIRNLSVLSSTDVSSRVVDSVSVRVQENRPQNSNTLDRSRESANRVIDTINLIGDTTDDLEALTKSLGGILQQASGQEIPERRLNALESEANELVNKIKEIAVNAPSGRALPNSEQDKVRSEIEERIGKSLDAILPDDAKHAFGIGPVTLSRKESIINTLAQIESAKKRLEETRSTTNDARIEVGNIISNLDVAAQNSEAAQTSVRDLDQAVQLATLARTEISIDPEEALGSVGDLGRRATRLLE